MTRPNFLCIGAQKSATTWLYQWFLRREDVYVPRTIKEVMFFDVKANFDKGISWYESFFDDVNREQSIGEITPGYLWVSGEHERWGAPSKFRQEIPKRIYEYLGAEVKLVAILRNPIDRAMSGFLHHKGKGRINEGKRFSDFARRFGVVHMGFYSAHLRDYLQIFDIKNFHIVTYEEFFSSHEARKALSLFVSDLDDDGDWLTGNRIHQGSGFVRTPEGVCDNKGILIADNSDVANLIDIYYKDVNELSNLIDIDLSHWQEFS